MKCLTLPICLFDTMRSLCNNLLHTHAHTHTHTHTHTPSSFTTIVSVVPRSLELIHTNTNLFQTVHTHTHRTQQKIQLRTRACTQRENKRHWKTACLPASLHMLCLPSLKVMGAHHAYTHMRTHTSSHIIPNCHISKILMVSTPA